jgi:peptidoglycan/LPS O-acetylase OafA/YrhL
LESRHIAQDSPAHHPRLELRALTGLRGVAATVVALTHFHPTLPYDLQEFFFWHDAAVDLFFCLSGFTLSYVYSGTNFQFSRYLTARIARIYPLYLVTLIIVGATYTLPHQDCMFQCTPVPMSGQAFSINTCSTKSVTAVLAG